MISRLRLSSVAPCAWALLAVLLVAAQAAADEVFYRLPVTDLKFSSGEFPDGPDETTTGGPAMPSPQSVTPRVVIDGEGEVYVHTPAGPLPQTTFHQPAQDVLVIRLPVARKITGTLFWPTGDMSGFVKMPFAVEAEPGDFKNDFLAAKQSHYQALMNRGIAGTAWFRHQVREVSQAAGQAVDQLAVNARSVNGIDSLDRTFELFSGGRAISENLQLDRALPAIGKNETLVPLDSLQGITVAEIDWKPLIKGMQPATDPLAKLVPADQHLVLFPSFAAFADVTNRLAKQGASALRLAQPQTNDPQWVARYERQLGISLAGLNKAIGPQMIGSVALTGSDPYFLSGTDVALVFETTQRELLIKGVQVSAAANADAKKVAGKIGGLAYTGFVSPDRRVSSYTASLDGAVIVTNSLYQIERFAAVVDKKTPAVASLDEFTFFRNRYPRGDKEESALVFLSDATIRRWCGPRWRIGASREIRDAAVLAELQAAAMDTLVQKKIKAGPVTTDLPFADGGDLTLSADGVRSSALGSFDSLTPIAELKFDQVTKAEADAYSAWRDRYQSNWRWAFDPIALRLSVADGRLAADLSVVPLIVGSEYRDFVAISRGATIAPDAGDRHDSIAQLILSLNINSDLFRSGEEMVGRVAAGNNNIINPLSWLGQSISLYADDDPLWGEIVGKNEKQRADYQRNASRMPVALWAEVTDGLKLTLFLGAVRTSIEQFAPGMSKWEPLEYRGQPYVRITPTERAMPHDKDGKPIGVELFYVASGKFLMFTANEALLKRALDRQVAREAAAGDAAGKAPADEKKASTAAKQAPPAKDLAAPAQRELQPWLGTNLGLQLDGQWLSRLIDFGREPYQQWVRIQSWSNLPILNEWRRLYPDEDPLAVHERVWHERLVCPGGGQYVWNKDWQTMESTVYGHPGEPKDGPAVPLELLKFRFANFGVSFEGQGLRARMTLDRDVPAVKAPPAGKTEPAVKTDKAK